MAGGYGSRIGVLVNAARGLLDGVRQYARICGLPPETLGHVLGLMPVEAGSDILE
jgi:hypothetical protein